MDISTIIGFVFGTICILVSIILGEGLFKQFMDAPSVFIVVGGLASALLIAYPIPFPLAYMKLLLFQLHLLL